MTQAAALALAFLLPGEFPEGPVDLAVICRDAGGLWPAPAWQAHPSAPKAVPGIEGRRCRLLARPRSAAFYAASREILWRRDAAPVFVEPRWLRTVRMSGRAETIAWLGVDDDPAVECHAAGDAAECRFVPLEAAGLLFAEADGQRRAAIFGERAIDSSSILGPGRLLRVHSSSATPIEARALRLERSLRLGGSRLLEARPVSGVSIVPVGRRAFWVSGAADRAFIEIRSGGSAPQRIPMASLAGPPNVPFDTRLWIGEGIEGDVSASSGAAGGTTVVLSRIVDEGDASVKEDEKPRERVAEVVTDAAGRFRFIGLTRDRYELLAIHPEHGRARRVFTPPDYPRLVLKPRARIRGRVIRNGIPVAAALIRLLPALESVASAPNPLLLASPAARSRADGRFEINALDEVRFVLAISTAEGSARLDLGDPANLGEIVELGDLRLEDPPSVEVIADIPAGCTLQAAGPMGSSGLSIVAAVPLDNGRWRFTPPMPGRWLFAAICGDKELAMDPAFVDTASPSRQPVVLRVRR